VPYLRYLCLFAHSGVQQIRYCVVFLFCLFFVDLEREDVFLAQTALQKDFLRPYSQYFSIGSYKSFAPLSHPSSISAAFNDIVKLFLVLNELREYRRGNTK
jgi:hypothetical protein